MAFGLSTSYTFDPSVRKLFECIGGIGAKCVLLNDSASLLSLDGTAQLSHLGDVPSVMSMAQLPLLVTHVEVAGEAITNAVIENVGAERTLWNNFGPTEVSVDVTGRLVTGMARLSSIGNPLRNVMAYVCELSHNIDPTGGSCKHQLSPSAQHTA